MKKFVRIFVCFLVFYLLVDILTYLVLRSTYTKKDININFDQPQVEITSCKVSVENGSITGKITNNTGADIEDQFVKFDLISKNGNVMGTEYYYVSELGEGETMDFELDFTSDMVDSIDMTVLDKEEFVEEVGEDTAMKIDWDTAKATLKKIGEKGTVFGRFLSKYFNINDIDEGRITFFGKPVDFNPWILLGSVVLIAPWL